MKTMKTAAGKALVILIIFSILCGIVYPFVMTGFAQLFFRDKASGSIIEIDGTKYGSELLGQQFTGPEYMWGRIMNTDTGSYKSSDGGPAFYSGASNKSPAGEEFEKAVKERAAMIRLANPEADMDKIPVDLVTVSGSGLDPHISVAAAQYQTPRLARERGLAESEVNKIIDKYTTGRLFGIFGEEVVNVLEVNLALDGILK